MERALCWYPAVKCRDKKKLHGRPWVQLIALPSLVHKFRHHRALGRPQLFRCVHRWVRITCVRIAMTCKRKLEKTHKCAFTGVESTREHRLRAPCSAATGAPRHLMTRCLKCVHNTTVWICLACWASIAAKTKELVGKWEGKFHLLRQPVYDALAGSVDFDKLAQGECDGGSVLTKHQDGQWEWNGCCPMCVDFRFKELPRVLTLASSLALPAVTERTVSGTVNGLSALGVEYLQEVTPATAQTCTPHPRTASPFHARS